MTINQLIEQIRTQLHAMTATQRHETIERIVDGYCRHCGADESAMRSGCQCNNDE